MRFAKRGNQLETIPVRHHDIRDHEVEIILGQISQGFVGAADRDDRVTAIAQPVNEKIAHAFFIVRHQYRESYDSNVSHGLHATLQRAAMSTRSNSFNAAQFSVKSKLGWRRARFSWPQLIQLELSPGTAGVSPASAIRVGGTRAVRGRCSSERSRIRHAGETPAVPGKYQASANSPRFDRPADGPATFAEASGLRFPFSALPQIISDDGERPASRAVSVSAPCPRTN